MLPCEYCGRLCRWEMISVPACCRNCRECPVVMISLLAPAVLLLLALAYLLATGAR